MSFIDLVKIEFKKVKRSKILALLIFPPLLVVVSGVYSLSMYLTPEYENAWAAMFIQSSLLFGYYLLPFTMVVVCVMIANREIQNNGILKMLALPIDKSRIALAKFFVLLSYLIFELAIFFFFFTIAGTVATLAMQVEEVVPIIYLLSWTAKLFFTTIPCISIMWAITVFFEKPLFSVGLNLLLIIPGVLVANTPIRFLYPYCYSGYVVSNALHTISSESMPKVNDSDLTFFILCGVILTSTSLYIAVTQFGRKEMK